MTPFEVKTQPRVDRPGLRAFGPGRIVVARSAHLSAIMNYLERKTPIHDPGGGGYLVERWIRGCAAQIGCFFGRSGFPMAPFFI